MKTRYIKLGPLNVYLQYSHRLTENIILETIKIIHKSPNFKTPDLEKYTIQNINDEIIKRIKQGYLVKNFEFKSLDDHIEIKYYGRFTYHSKNNFLLITQ